MNAQVIRVGGFFSGIGAHHSAIDRIKGLFPGLDFKVVFQCENDPKTALAYDLMHGKTPNLGDITAVHDIGGALAVDILFWTPPCQDISLAGRQAGNNKDSGTRSSLAHEIPRILENTPERERPRYLIFEEVPTMLSYKFIDNFKEILARLSALGYNHQYGIMSATDYEIPQTRKRCFMISKLNGPAPPLPKPRSLTTCLKDYLEVEPVAPHYYLSDDRIKGLIWSNEKEQQANRGFKFEPTDGQTVDHTITCKEGQVKTSNYVKINADKLIEWLESN